MAHFIARGRGGEVAAWQRRRGNPIAFFTEASLDLAEEPELMWRMVDANIVSVYVGIESSDDAALLETKKRQNVRPRAGSSTWAEGSGRRQESHHMTAGP